MKSQVMSDSPPFTDADVARHRVLIDRRERAEVATREANLRAGHPRDLCEYLADGFDCDSPPIVDRPAKVSVPFAHNRGLGIPKEEDV
jgi:hypothetical protein